MRARCSSRSEVDPKLSQQPRAQRGKSRLRVITRARQCDRDIGGDAAVRQHQHAVGQQHRLVHVMRHQQRGRRVRAPRLLLLDEPFAALDALTRMKMHALVLSLWRTHAPATLLVTHDVDEAVLLADRILVLADGQIAADISVALPRPRRHAHPLFAPLRARLLAELGVELPETDDEADSEAERVPDFAGTV